MSPVALIFWMCAALVVNLMGFMNLAAVLPILIREWGLSSTEAGWLGGIFFAGYVSTVAVLTALTDRFDPKRIYLICAVVSALGAFGFAALADGFWSALGFRFLAGVGLAGCHMPGLKGLTDQLEGKGYPAARGVTYYTAIFAFGSGLSILIGGEVADLLGWRAAFWVAGIGAGTAFAIVLVVLPRKKGAPVASGRHVLDFRPVLRNRRVMGFVLGGLGAAWEVFASRVWLVTYFAVLVTASPSEGHLVKPSVASFLVSAAGVPISMVVGEFAIRLPRVRLLLAITAASVLMVLALAVSQPLPYNLVVLLALVFGMTSFGRTAANTGGAVAAAHPSERGAALAVLSTLSFSGGIIGPLVVGIALDAAGGAHDPSAWTMGFLALAAGPVLGFLALYFLARERPAPSAVAPTR